MNIVATIVAALAVAAPAVLLTGDKALVIPAHEVQAQLAKPSRWPRREAAVAGLWPSLAIWL